MTKDYQYSFYDMSDIFHQTALLYTGSNLAIDYGTGEKYTAVEVHLLKYIINHPGKTVTDLSRDWNKTKAAISQMMTKMEQKGVIDKKTAPDSNKRQLYYATAKGLELNDAHMQHDTDTFGRVVAYLRQTCSQDEINSCFHVLQEYIVMKREKRILL